MADVMNLPVSWDSQRSGVGPSPAVFGSFNVEVSNPHVGFEVWVDFLQGIHNVDSAEFRGFKAFLDTDSTIALMAAEVGGVLELASAATDNRNPAIATGGDIAGIVKPYTTTPKKWAIEARLKLSSILDQGFFFGVAAIGCCADNGILTDNSGVLIDKNCIGFLVVTAAPATVNAVYKDAGQTAVTAAAAVYTLVANTYVKLGMLYTGKGSKALRYFVNGVEVGSVTKAVCAAVGFPDAEIMTGIVSLKTGSC